MDDERVPHYSWRCPFGLPLWVAPCRGNLPGGNLPGAKEGATKGATCQGQPKGKGKGSINLSAVMLYVLAVEGACLVVCTVLTFLSTVWLYEAYYCLARTDKVPWSLIGPVMAMSGAVYVLVTTPLRAAALVCVAGLAYGARAQQCDCFSFESHVVWMRGSQTKETRTSSCREYMWSAAPLTHPFRIDAANSPMVHVTIALHPRCVVYGVEREHTDMTRALCLDKFRFVFKTTATVAFDFPFVVPPSEMRTFLRHMANQNPRVYAHSVRAHADQTVEGELPPYVIFLDGCYRVDSVLI